MHRLFRSVLRALPAILAACCIHVRAADWRPDFRPPALAIEGAKIVVTADKVIEPGTIIIRKGIVEAVGKTEEVKIPPDAFVVAGKGLTIYPGWIDAYTLTGLGTGVPRSRTGSGRNLPLNEFSSPFTPPDDRIGITPEFAVADSLNLGDPTAEGRRKLGFTSQIVAPGGAILTGKGALASTTGYPRREILIVPHVGLHVNLRAPFEPNPAPPSGDAPSGLALRFRGRQPGGPSGYPSAMMGVIAHLRQQISDAAHYRQLQEHGRRHGGPRVPVDPALETILEAIDGKLPVWWQAESADEIHRALDLSAEFGFEPVIVGGREATKAVDRLKAGNVPVVLRLNYPTKPKVPTKAEFAKKKDSERVEPLRVTERKLEIWKEMVSTAATLHKAGVKFAFSTDGLQRPDQFAEKLREVITEGLPEPVAAAALASGGAAMAKASDRLGTLEPGKYGHLVALTGPIADSKTKVRLVAADGILFDFDAPTILPKESTPSGRAGRPSEVARGESGDKPGESKPEEKADTAETDKGESKPTDAAKKEPGKDKPETKTTPAEPKKEEPKKEAQPKPEPKKDEPKPEARKDEPKKDEPGKAETKKDEPAKEEPKFVDVLTELDSDRKVAFKTGGNVLIRGATVITISEKGTLKNASILVKDGKIAAIGTELTRPEGVTEIDAKGLFVMPGMIDTHSHMAISGGVNEATLSIVPEVRVADVVNGQDPTIYHALAGGTTAARLLHGSANTIGGQDVIIKLLPGRAGREMILKDEKRPQGVKFALGENVTRSTGRFPNTRMGVEATIERAFRQGAAYAEARKRWEALRDQKGEAAGPAPRRDLRLEALSRIVAGDIKIHSHCYRADEILMLLRTAERHGVKVQSLQHVLEGYKVAPEIAAHGASASTFSDWWAYKIEAFDAIPANAAVMAEAGVSPVIKSDDPELVRHLNLEASKSIKYGGMADEAALAMVTINSARELGLAHRMGSIEVGKDADLAIFDAHPLDTFSKCRLSLINGEVEFALGKTAEEAARPKVLGSLAKAEAPAAPANAKFTDDLDNRKTRVFVGATVHPVSGPAIAEGVVVVQKDKIVAVGGKETAIPEGAEVIDLKGYDLWPGMIEAGSQVGLFEVGSLRETQDVSDSATFQPELTTSTAIHPDSELIPVTRANGVLTVLAQPSGGGISGQSAVVNLHGWIPTEMVVHDRAALHVQIPGYIPPRDNAEFGMAYEGDHHCGCEAMAAGGHVHGQQAMADDPPASPGTNDGDRSQALTRRRQRLEEIGEQFRLAIRYEEARKAAAEGKTEAIESDPRMEALLPYAKGEKPVIFEANHRGEILDAIALAKALKVKAVIGGGREAWKVAAQIKESGFPVLIGGVLQLPSENYDPYDAPYANAAKLHAAGVKFAIQSGGGGPDQATAARNLPFEAGTAVAFGLPEDEALKSVTLYPAEILGFSDKLGSIAPGKKANLIVSRGSILQATTPVDLIVIDGKVITPQSRHTRLADKYRERIRQVKEGLVPIGVGKKEK
jgi:imidazolonepropionase-like amidohydrolase